MDYTKGERILYCGEERWYVLVRDKPNRPDVIIGAFDNKEDAILFLAAPELYEACKFISYMWREKTSIYKHERDKAEELLDKALAKVEK